MQLKAACARMEQTLLVCTCRCICRPGCTRALLYACCSECSRGLPSDVVARCMLSQVPPPAPCAPPSRYTSAALCSRTSRCPHRP
eukprot:366024-Chlamydomonas_euryale.AAC.7